MQRVESAEQIEAFDLYYSLGSERSLQIVADKLGILSNLDEELDTFVKTLDTEDNKIDFLIEHTKKITVLENKDLIVELDLVAGAIIAGKDFLLYVHDSMSQHYGRIGFYPYGKRKTRRTFVRNQLRGDQP